MSAHDRGTALLLVLWVTALLAALLVGVGASSRSHGEAALYGSEQVRAELAAEAGVAHAVAGLRAPVPGARWVPDGRAYRFRFDRAKVTVRVVDVSGLVDLNAAPANLLRRLLVAAGADSARADRTLAAIAARRVPPATGTASIGRRFHALDQLAALPGMDAKLYARLQPQVTVFSGRSYPAAAYAGPPVLAAERAIGEPAATALVKARRAQPAAAGVAAHDAGGTGTLVAGYGGGVERVFASAVMPDGTRADLDVTLRLALTAAMARPYKVLDWRAGSGRAL